MVSLHVHRWGLSKQLLRETQDADLGVHPIVLRDSALIRHLQNLGYERVAGGTYGRPLGDLDDSQQGKPEPHQAIVDILIPSYTSRPRDNVYVDQDVTTTEVPGLAMALARDGVEVELELHRLNSTVLKTIVVLADELSGLIIKALAWDRRNATRDAVDVWRMLEITAVAGVRGDAELQSAVGKKAKSVLRRDFGRPKGAGLVAIDGARPLSAEAQTQRRTRIRALTDRLYYA